MNKKKWYIAAIILALILIGGSIGVIIGINNRSNENMLKLAQEYMNRGEYERALDLIDKVLLQEYDNETALQLQELVLAIKRGDLQIQDPLDDITQDTTHAIIEDTDSFDPFDDSAPSANSQNDKIALTNDDAAFRRAEALAKRQEEEARIARLDEADRAYAQQIQTLLTQAEENLNDQQYVQARALLQDVLDISLQDKNQTNRYHSLATSKLAESYRLEKPNDTQAQETALQLTQDAIRLDNQNAEPFYTQGLIYTTRQQLSQAEQALEAAVSRDAMDAAAWFALGNVRYRLKLFAGAKDAYRKCVDIAPTYRNGYFNLGITYINLNDQNNALQSFQGALTADRTDHRAYFRIGSIQLANKKFTSAINALEQAIDLNPENAIYRARLGQAYYQQGNFNKAQEHYTIASRIQPENATHHYNTALANYSLGEYTLALQSIKKSIEQDETEPKSFYTQGQIYDELGDHAQAIQSLTTAIQINRQYVSAMAELGRILNDVGETTRSLALLESAFDIAPDSPEVNNALGEVYLAINKFQDSITHFRSASEKLDDTNIDYNLALAYLGAQLYPNAQTLLENIIAHNSQYWAAYHRLGEVYIAQGDTQSAETILRTLINNNGQYPERGEVEFLLRGL